jgi:hypothetical protein
MEPTKEKMKDAAAPYSLGGMTVNGTYIHNYNGGTISENINWGT